MRVVVTAHQLRLAAAALGAVILLAAVAAAGFPYYTLDLAGRTRSPLHSQFRPSGSVGLRLGILGGVLFGILFLYPIRKRWKWLGRKGKTKHWLDFHILCGITAPMVITLHSSFKLGGIAGMAYWIMIAVALSGFVGRYLYSQIPRTLSAAEMTLKELETALDELARTLESQPYFTSDELQPLFQTPSPEQVERMPAASAFFHMVLLDLGRLFRVAALRRRCLSASARLLTLGGLLPSSNRHLESSISAVRRQAWLSARVAFLRRAHQIFHLWHVVHRPFSYSFAVLAAVHIIVVVILGYS